MMNWKKACGEKMKKDKTNTLVKYNAKFTVKFWGNLGFFLFNKGR